MVSFKFTLDSALEAESRGELLEWALEFLRGEGGNRKLADHLIAHKPEVILLKQFALGKLNRNVGPEEGMLWPEDEQIWEARVNELAGVIKNGVMVPPLIVTDFWAPLGLSDGGHRHEALMRCGRDEYWVIFFFSRPESLRQLETV